MFDENGCQLTNLVSISWIKVKLFRSWEGSCLFSVTNSYFGQILVVTCGPWWLTFVLKLFGLHKKIYIFMAPWFSEVQSFDFLHSILQYWEQNPEGRKVFSSRCLSTHSFLKTSSLCGLLYQKYGSHIRQVSQNLTNAFLNKENSIRCCKILQNGKKLFYSRKHCES